MGTWDRLRYTPRAGPDLNIPSPPSPDRGLHVHCPCAHLYPHVYVVPMCPCTSTGAKEYIHSWPKRTYMHMHAYAYVHIRPHTSTYIRMHTRAYAYIRMHTHAYARTHMHTCTHTHEHACLPTCPCTSTEPSPPPRALPYARAPSPSPRTHRPSPHAPAKCEARNVK